MTEEEWLACDDPARMAEYLRERGSDRKFRLFAVACCRTVENLLIDEGLQLLDACESFADDSLEWRELTALREAAKTPNLYGQADSRRSGIAAQNALGAVLATAWGKQIRGWHAVGDVVRRCFEARHYSGWKQAPREFSDLFRDIFTFHPITLDPSWLTSTVTALAQGMYDSRDFSTMPILADALMDAGCDNESILQHCRRQGARVRGCWVVDLILQKS